MATVGGGRAVGRTTPLHARPSLLVAILGVLLLACGDGAEAPSDEAIEAAMVDQLGADDDQAACIRRYLVQDYEVSDLRTLIADGMGGLPQGRWEPFLTASLACLTLDLEER